MRNHKVYQTVQTGPRMTTEYQARFHPTRKYVATSKFKQTKPRDAHHPQTEPTANVTTASSVYVSAQWIRKPPKNDTSGSQTPLSNDCSTIYQNDFKAWRAEQRKPFRLHHLLSTEQGLSRAEDEKSTKQTKEVTPFEGVTTYTSDFVPHPVQPRSNRAKNVYQSSKHLLQESYKPKVTSATDHHNEAKVSQQFQVWSLETNRSSTQTKTKELPQTVVKNEFYRAWNGPQAFASACETSDWLMKTTFSRYDPEPAETKQILSGPQSKVGDSTPFKSTEQRHQRPAESRGLSAFECSTGVFWSDSLTEG